MNDEQMTDVVPTCDHPGMGHGTFSYTGICPRCRKCKFIGHGPLCVDCYDDPATYPPVSFGGVA